MAGELSDIYFSDMDATTQEKARAMAAALAKQQAMGYGMQLMTGNSGAIGPAMLQDAGSQQKQLYEAPKALNTERVARQNANTNELYRRDQATNMQEQRQLQRQALEQDAWAPVAAKDGTTMLFNKKTRETVGLTGPMAPKPSAFEARAMDKAMRGANWSPDWEPTEELTKLIQEKGADPAAPGPLHDNLVELGKLHKSAALLDDLGQTMFSKVLNRYPNGVPAGDAAVWAQELSTNMRAAEMPQMGMKSLREYDLPILNQIISDPSSVAAEIKSAAGMARLTEKFRAAIAIAKQRAITQGNVAYNRPKGSGAGKVSGRYAGFTPITNEPLGAQPQQSLGDKATSALNAVQGNPTPADNRPSRTVGGETRYWDGKAWVR